MITGFNVKVNTNTVIGKLSPDKFIIAWFTDRTRAVLYKSFRYADHNTA